MNSVLYLIILVLVLAVVGLVIQLVRKSKASQVKEGALATTSQEVDEVVKADSASNALFATLSHELRTPLNGLLGIAQMLNEERDDEDIQAIEGCARHMLAVLHTLVNLSKIQTEWDELPEYREWVSLYELTEQLKKNLSFRAGLRGLRIELNHQDKTTRVRGDWDHLKNMVENTLLGSIECVALHERPAEEQVMQVSWTAEGSDVHILVVNPLEVYSAERQQRIREVFDQTTGATHARIEMQYLYWAVSTALLEKYNGVMLSKELDEGGVTSSLSFEMEQMQASPTAKKPMGGLSLNNTKSSKELRAATKLPVTLSILVAEDDPIARSLMATVLKHMGQEASFATNGREVIEKIGVGQGYDLILMDIDMPVMDGVSAAIALRNGEAGEVGTSIPIVAVTAFNTLSDQGKFKRAGMNHFLPKPVKLQDLRSVLLEVVRENKRLAEV